LNEMYTHILSDDEAIFAEPAELVHEATRQKLERNGVLLQTTLGKQDNYASARGFTLRLITRRYNVVLQGEVESNTKFTTLQKATKVAGLTTPSKIAQYNSKSIAPSGKQFTTQLVVTKEVIGRIISPMHQAKLEALIDGMTIAQTLGQSRKTKKKMTKKILMEVVPIAGHG
jgi:galactokinase/mevalonate kinase-like predicted kinase